MTIRRRLTVVLAGMLFIATTGRSLEAQDRPRLLVLLIVDQMRADYIDKYGHTWTQGLRRLLDDGAWFRQAAYAHANTVTCAGHATIITGTLPATHGIISNSWLDRASSRLIPCMADPQASLVSYGAPAKGGTSVANLRVPTLPDELRAQLPVPPRIVTFSMKDYTATILAGRRADAATWFNQAAQSWVTSSAFTKKPVPFIERFIKSHPLEAELEKIWTLSLPRSSYEFDDQGLGEKPPAAWTPTFPHPLKGPGVSQSDTYGEWQESPFSDAYLAAMAEAAVDELHLGKGPGTDFLAISFSALDVAGHDFGPRSYEVQDVLARLDGTIGRLLTHLDRVVSPANYVVALTADHGVSPIPEQMAAEELGGGRIVANEIVERVENVLKSALGSGRHIARMLSGEIYFAPGVLQKLAANPEASRAAVDQIQAVPGVSRVLRGEELTKGRASDDPVVRAASAGYYPGRSGDLLIVPRPYWFFVSADGTAQPGLATTHGTPHGYDQRVPVILKGPSVKGGHYLKPITPADIAPTLAFLCGVTLSRADGRVLVQALARPPAVPRAGRHSEPQTR